MQLDIRIAIWNGNGLSDHTQETETYSNTQFFDIFLISETHFTFRTYFHIRGYDTIAANRPDHRADAGSVILIKSTINYKVLPTISINYIQPAEVKFSTNCGEISVFAIYSPSRHSISYQEYENFFSNLRSRFLVGGDFIAKHSW